MTSHWSGHGGGRGSTTDLPSDFVELLLDTKSYKIEVQTVTEPKVWYGNQARFETYFEAGIYAINLAERWIQVRDVRVIAG